MGFLGKENECTNNNIIDSMLSSAEVVHYGCPLATIANPILHCCGVDTNQLNFPILLQSNNLTRS